jgi:hypothetical protein
MKPLIYVSGPFSGPDFEKNRAAAQEMGRRIWEAGGIAVIPHNLSVGMDDLGTWEEWMRVCLALVNQCDALSFLPGWEGSRGAVAEIARAELNSLFVYSAEYFERWEEWIRDWTEEHK